MAASIQVHVPSHVHAYSQRVVRLHRIRASVHLTPAVAVSGLRGRGRGARPGGCFRSGVQRNLVSLNVMLSINICFLATMLMRT